MERGRLSGAVADHLNQHHRALSRVRAIHARSAVTGHRVPRTAVPLSSAAMQRVAVDALRRRRRRRRHRRASCVSQTAADAFRPRLDADDFVSACPPRAQIIRR